MDRSSEAEDGKEEADEVAADRLRDDSLVHEAPGLREGINGGKGEHEAQ